MRQYPRSSLEMEGGELYSITQVSIDETNGATNVSTFRKAGNGITFGPNSYSITFDIANATTPMERDFRDAVRNKRIKQLVVKSPDGTRDVVNGAFSQRSMSSAMEGPTSTTMTFTGHAE